MGNRKISDDLKEASLRMKARLYSDEEVLAIVGFSRSTLKRAARRKALTGSVARKQAIGRGRPRILALSDCQYLLKLARFKPTMFLDEYARRLEEGRFLDALLATIHRTLARAGLNIKRVQKLAAERSPTIRADFVRRISRYPAKYLMCIDEVSKDDRTYARLWGRSRTGTRVEHHAPFVRKHRFSMVAVLALDEGIVAAKVVEGSFVQKTFVEYLRDDVASLCSHHCASSLLTNK
jgi:transposase